MSVSLSLAARLSSRRSVLLLGLFLGAPGSALAQETGAGQAPPSPEELPPYVLQRGDTFTIKVFGRSELEETIQIRPDGKISAVLLDEVTAAGLTVAELDQILTSRYAEFFRDPNVTIIMRTYAALKVFVAGEVERPGPIPMLGDLTALAAVMEAGGFKGSARTDSVILLRNEGNGVPKVQRVDLKAALNDGKGDLPLKPYDVVFVPLSRIAKVDKFVSEYIRQLIPITVTAGFQYITGGQAVVIP